VSLLVGGITGYGAPGVVILTGGLIADTRTDGNSFAGIRVNDDGTIDKRTSLGGYQQISASTDWIIPNVLADDTYDVRIVNVVWNAGSSFWIQAAGENVWTHLGFPREWSVIDTDPTATGNQDVEFTLQIRRNGGSVIDSASFQLTADYET